MGKASTCADTTRLNPTDDSKSWLSVDQPILKTPGVVLLLAVTGIVCPLSIDMYTPAVPSMPEQFNTTAAMVNLTITGFYLFFTLGMLIFGPVSDKCGRKPVLVGGIAAFTAGSLLCAFAWSIEALIAFRLIEALGAGAICAVSTAIVKDCFKPGKRTTLLSILQILMVIGPVAAPLLGGFILRFSTWHATFAVLTAIGAASMALSLAFKESLPADQRVSGGAFESVSRMGAIAKNRGFMAFLTLVSLFSVGFMAYVAVASYIYVNDFGITAQQYSYFFAATAGISVLGPLVYLRLEIKSMTPRKFTHVVLVLSLAFSAGILIIGGISVWVFFALMAAFSFVEAAMRPYATNILLAQNESDAGSASALLNFELNIAGVIGMLLISLWPMEAYIQGLGALMVIAMAFALALWVYLLTSKKAHLAELER